MLCFYQVFLLTLNVCQCFCMGTWIQPSSYQLKANNLSLGDLKLSFLLKLYKSKIQLKGKYRIKVLLHIKWILFFNAFSFVNLYSYIYV
jgi:hypothetical protein